MAFGSIQGDTFQCMNLHTNLDLRPTVPGCHRGECKNSGDDQHPAPHQHCKTPPTAFPWAHPQVTK